jgi:hypothetical protein
MSNYELTGTVKFIGDTVKVSEKFSKRDLVVSDGNAMYPQVISFQVTQDKCDLLDTIMEGQEVEVSFNLRGREWTSPQGETKYFNTLEAWRIDTVGSEPAPAPTIDLSAPDPLATAEDDVPF